MEDSIDSPILKRETRRKIKFTYFAQRIASLEIIFYSAIFSPLTNILHQVNLILHFYELFPFCCMCLAGISIPDIGLAVRVFANGLGDLGSIPGQVIPKTQKMVLDASLLNTQHYKVRIKGKIEQSREGVAPSPTPWCSSYRKGSLRVTLDYGRQLYFTYSSSSSSSSSSVTTQISLILSYHPSLSSLPLTDLPKYILCPLSGDVNNFLLVGQDLLVHA